MHYEFFASQRPKLIKACLLGIAIFPSSLRATFKMMRLLTFLIVFPEVALEVGKLPLTLAKEANWPVANYL
jgi:hypothetical protein